MMKIQTTPKDFLGRPLEVGNLVVCTTSIGRLTVCEVLEIVSAHHVKVSVIDYYAQLRDPSRNQTVGTVNNTNLIRIEESDLVFHLLNKEQ